MFWKRRIKRYEPISLIISSWMNGTDKPFGSCEHEVYLSEGDVIYFLQKDSITYVVFGFCIMSEIVDTYAASEVRNRDVFDDSVIICVKAGE